MSEDIPQFCGPCGEIIHAVEAESLAQSDSGVEFPPDVIEPRSWKIKGAGQYGSDVDVVSLDAYHDLAAQNVSFKNQTVRWAHRALALEKALHRLVALRDGPIPDTVAAKEQAEDEAYHRARVLLENRRSGDA